MRRILLMLALSLPSAAESPFRFVDVTSEAGVGVTSLCGAPQGEKGWLIESMGTGAGWLDYDGDGALDLYVVNGSSYDRKPGKGEPNRLFRGDGDGGFTEVTEKAGVGDSGWGTGLAVGDYDGDGDADIYVTNFGANVLYRNDGDGTFTDVTAKAGVGDPLYSASATFLDHDRDGDLDLYVGNYMLSDPAVVPRRGSEAAKKAACQYKGIQVACGPLGQTPLQDTFYRNNGDGTFTDVTAAAGMKLATPRFTLAAVAADYDNDGWVDLYVANDSVQNSLWRNKRDGTFEDVGVVTLSALNADGQTQAGMGADFGDINNDGWMDLVVTNFSNDLNTLYRNVGGKMFSDDSTLAGMGVTYFALSWGTGLHDFDLDGDLDLFIANGHVYPEVAGYSIGTDFEQANHLFVNDGGKFKEVGAASGPGLAVKKSFRSAAFADYDDDGDIDVYLTALDDRSVLLRNDSPRNGHWLTLDLGEGYPVGTTAIVTAAGQRRQRQLKGGGSYLAAHPPRLHFGLGQAARYERIDIRWPDGTVQQLPGDAADRRLRVEKSAP